MTTGTTAGKYAPRTRVPIDRSAKEIGDILRRYGADDEYMAGPMQGSATVMFRHQGRSVLIRLRLPQPDDKDISHTPQRQKREPAALKVALEQARRRVWRVMVLLLKSNFELVAEGARTFDQAFLSDLVLPGGGTVGDDVIPVVEEARRTGRMPDELLPNLKPPARGPGLPEGTVIELGTGTGR